MSEPLACARLLTLTILAATAIASTARAQTSPLAATFEDLPALLKVGTRVSVVDVQGRRVNGAVGGLSDTSIDVHARGLHSKDYHFDLEQIREIAAIDSTRDGFWAGVALGAVPGVVLATLIYRYCESESSSQNSCVRAFPILGGVTGMIGGLVGVAMDGAVNHGPVLYSQPSAGSRRVTLQPFASPGARYGGLMVSVGF